VNRIRWHQRPARRWLGNPHAQTIIGSLGRVTLGDGEPVGIPVPGGVLGARVHAASFRNSRVVALFHGAAGDGDEAFVLRTAARLVRRGVDAVRISLRGSGASVACDRPVLHGGLVDDVDAVVAWLRRRYRRVGLVGFSMGGAIAVRTACAWGGAPPDGVIGIAAISPPLDLARAAAYLDRPAATPYRAFMLARLWARYRMIRSTLPAAVAELGATSFARAETYNDRLVAPLFGFRNAADYYARASSLPLIGAIRVPTLVVHAEDDPVVPVAPVREAWATKSSDVAIEITARGGHVGFVDGGDDERYWAESRAVAFLEQRAT
jgi:predicted alpha/beta-fold hydrolase